MARLQPRTVSLLCGWYLIGLAVIVAIAFFRRWRIERRLGRRFIRIESTLRGARAMAPILGATSLMQFLVACHQVGIGRFDKVEAAKQGLLAGAFGAAALLCWLWQHALRSIEFGANGYCRHVLSFTPWGHEPVRWTRHGTNSMTIVFGRAGYRSLAVADEQLPVVESLLARHGGHGT